MGSIKLPHASGNSMSIAAPATNPASDLELKLPATIGTANQVLRNSSTPGTLEFGSAGKILNVASTTKTDIFSSTTAQAWTDITGVSIAITPSSTSSKILINTSITYGLDHGYSMIIFRLMRGSTEIGIADAANNRPRGTFSGDPKDDAYLANACFTHLDSPSSTSEQTYKVQFYDYHGNTFYVNRTYRHWDASTYDFVGASNITVMEVGA